MSVFTEVKQRISCIDVAREYGLKLIPKGDHFVCLCPLHAEKTPSFVVHPDHFYCFGCGIGGDVIKLVEKLQGIQPIEAAREIVRRFGLPIEINVDKPIRPKRKRVYNQGDFLQALEAWRNEIFPIYVDLFRSLDEIIHNLCIDHPCFKSVVVLRADLDAITDLMISDRFEDVYKAYRLTKGGEVLAESI